MGTGLSDEELDAVVTKLKPYFRYFLDNLMLEDCDYLKTSCHEICNRVQEMF